MGSIESKIDQAQDEQDGGITIGGDAGDSPTKYTTIHTDKKVLDFLRLLEEYRIKCEAEGNYSEARKSRMKYEELLKKETIRQKNNIRTAQEQELTSIEGAQKS